MQDAKERDPGVSRETIRAVAGERVWVAVNQIKADKLEQHKRFVLDILMPAVEKVEPTAFRHTRFLLPVVLNEDEICTSVWLMDPLIEGADYDPMSILVKAYGQAQAEEYIKIWEEAEAGPQLLYDLTQTL